MSNTHKIQSNNGYIARLWLIKIYMFVKPQSHRIVRFLDRAIGGDLPVVRPIAKSAAISICNRILRLLLQPVVGHRATGGTRGRAINNDRATSGSDQRPIVRSIVATCDRSHDREVVRQVAPPIAMWEDK
jgi:hypothetical protein